MLDVMQIQEILPHRPPFLLVDKITEINLDEGYVIGYKNVSISDQVFAGHFPGHPIYPGVMILEGMAQTGGILAFQSMKDSVDPKSKVVYFTGMEEVKFKSPVRPGDKLVYKMSVVKNRGAMWVFSGEAYVDDTLCTQAILKAMIVDK
ncbi:3-hydroxyacyl-ACP dehydratase FabZ [Campylobacter sp. MG1]|uniref:3-hydroxyacyl-ACP dehydratase FabZ n=1 Tax=Campylobacter sp. MG1 TaxID=2976332 RepID=UPI00226C73BA|nr:3-hydroxyacyl-ACP dehydratase FabZ [Campylobacter sp. MG1]